MSDVIKSWQTPEYNKDWGLEAMHAANAYALEFYGQNTKVGVTDSGDLLQKHPELAGDRFNAVITPDGIFATTNDRYLPSMDTFNNGIYYKSEHFADRYNREGSEVVKHDMHIDKITRQFIPYVNDSHGTHVTGTVGANLDGKEFHGVAFGANIYEGNSGRTDSNNYGPFQDYNYVKVINNSWVTNTRIYVKPPMDTPEKIAEAKARQLEAWVAVQRGHAVANSLPVVTVNRTGFESAPDNKSGIRFWGNSFVFRPQGEELFRENSKDELCQIVEIDMKSCENVRHWWPFLRNRRIENYSPILKRFCD